MGWPPNDLPQSPKCWNCKNNDLSWCKNGIYEVIHPPLYLVMLIHVLIRVKMISIVDDVLISNVRWKIKLGFVYLESYIKKRPPSLYPIGKFCTLGSRYLNKEIFFCRNSWIFFVGCSCLWLESLFCLAFETFFRGIKYFWKIVFCM